MIIKKYESDYIESPGACSFCNDASKYVINTERCHHCGTFANNAHSIKAVLRPAVMWLCEYHFNVLHKEIIDIKK